MTAVLRCEGATVQFGAFTALRNVSLSFAADVRYGIIGPNGAGKTTLINVLSGRLPVTQGRVFLGDEDITRLPPYRRARRGLGRSFQITQVFPEMTVFENIRLAHQAAALRLQPFWRPIGTIRALREAADRTLAFIGLGHRRDTPAAILSHGDQRALEVGLALAAGTRVLLLDEPLAGVGQHEVPAAVDLIARAAVGRTMILIEHNMNALMRLSDQVIAMTAGEVLAQGTPAAIRADRRVRAAYLGDGPPAAGDESPAAGDESPAAGDGAPADDGETA
jgi:branched-chain amino acid transport system ATP-binding protein